MPNAETGRSNLPYPTEGQKPSIPVGIDPAAREQARLALIQYYGNNRDLTGVPELGDQFKTITPFLENIVVDPAIDKTELQKLFAPSEPNNTERTFLHRANTLVNLFDGTDSPDSHWKTCSYRHVSAVTETNIRIGEENFSVGGIGSSGAHEFLYMTQEQESTLLSEAMFEALIVSGMPMRMQDFDDKKLRDMISEKAQWLLESSAGSLTPLRRFAKPFVMQILSIDYDGVHRYEPHQTDPFKIYQRDIEANNKRFSLTSNCRDLSNFAIQGAKEIAEKLEIPLNPDIETYTFCPMHKYNKQYGHHYRDESLPLPGEFGRLRCPSHCAETQALVRSAYAAVIPILTGEHTSFLWSMTRHRPQPYDDMDFKYYYWDFLYMTPSSDSADIYMPKRLIIDDFINPFSQTSEMRMTPALFEILMERQIDLRPYETIRIGYQTLEYILIAGLPCDGHKQYPLDVIAKIPTAEIPLLEWSAVQHNEKELLYTSASPCLHCLNILQNRNIDMLVENIPWEELKGDDGLALEALSRLPIRTVVLHE
jgi:hypothetical protein